MRMEEATNERVQGSYYSVRHSSGLRIFVYPKEGSNSTYAIFGTRYGSVGTSFRRFDEQEVSTVSEGIAHFLEHKLFESEDGDAFARYAKTGASANAYTSFDMTCCLFPCIGNVYESLEILLNPVQFPYFTEQIVQKEQGTIGQEVRMYDDDPQWRIMFNLLEALYHHHPVKIDIIGTIESVAEITSEYLYHYYHTSYNLNNMAPRVVGNIDSERVLKLCDKMLKPSESTQIECIFEEEPASVVQGRVEQELSVTILLLQLGFEEPARRRNVQELAQMDVLLELLASDTSPLYRHLLDQNLINTASFGSEYSEGPGYAAVIFSGESKDPDAVVKEIRDKIERLCKEGIPTEAFERARKAVRGCNVVALDSAEAIANVMVSLTFAERKLLSYIGALATIQLSDVQKRLEEQLLTESSVLSVVFPIK